MLIKKVFNKIIKLKAQTPFCMLLSDYKKHDVIT